MKSVQNGVLLVGPMSSGPLVGGIENGIDMILRSPLVAKHDLKFFNSYRTRDSDRSKLARLKYQTSAFAAFARTLAKVRPRLVHVKVADGINFFQGVGYTALARMRGYPVLLQLHGGEFDTWYRGLGRFGRAAVRLGMRAPSALLVLSTYWRDFVRTLAPGRPIHVVPNGVELDRIPARCSRSDAMIRVLTVGAIGNRKGHFDIAGAATVLGPESPFVFRFVGSDDLGGEILELQRIISDNGLTSRINFVGSLTGDAKWAEFVNADIFLLPAYNENMPNSILEAMASRLPIICTDVGAVRQMVAEDGARFVVPGDRQGIVDALEWLRDNPKDCEAMGLANRQRVAAEYSFQRVAGDLDRLYEQYARRFANIGSPAHGVPKHSPQF